MTEKTVFEKLIAREYPVWPIYEDEKHIAILDLTPFEKGHTMVIPKKPYVTVWEMPEDEYLELQKVVLKVAKHIQQKLNCGINICQNNLPISGQQVPHVHFHIIPRREEKHLYHTELHINYDTPEEKNQYMADLKMD